MSESPSAGPARTRSLLSQICLLLVVLSVALLGIRLRQQLASFRELVSLAALIHLVAAALVYGVSLLLISYAFWLLLRWQGVLGISVSEGHCIYGRTQLAKYVPGNVFQFVARHVEYRSRGAGDLALGLAALYETLGLAGAAACLALLGLPVLGRGIVGERADQIWLTLGLALIASTCCVALLPKLVSWVLRRRGLSPTDGRLTTYRLAQLLPLYASFFVVSGTLALSLYARGAQTQRVLFSLIPGYALAWLCGFVVPGASAGLGVREAVIVLLFGDDSAALFTAIGMRIVTTLGDALLLLGVALWGRLLSQR